MVDDLRVDAPFPGLVRHLATRSADALARCTDEEHSRVPWGVLLASLGVAWRRAGRAWDTEAEKRAFREIIKSHERKTGGMEPAPNVEEALRKAYLLWSPAEVSPEVRAVLADPLATDRAALADMASREGVASSLFISPAAWAKVHPQSSNAHAHRASDPTTTTTTTAAAAATRVATTNLHHRVPFNAPGPGTESPSPSRPLSTTPSPSSGGGSTDLVGKEEGHPGTGVTVPTTRLSRVDYWILAAAVALFVRERGGALPLSGTLPDMSSSTEEYLALQAVYRGQSHADAQEVARYVKHVCAEMGVTVEDDQVGLGLGLDLGVGGDHSGDDRTHLHHGKRNGTSTSTGASSGTVPTTPAWSAVEHFCRHARTLHVRRPAPIVTLFPEDGVVEADDLEGVRRDARNRLRTLTQRDGSDEFRAVALWVALGACDHLRTIRARTPGTGRRGGNGGDEEEEGVHGRDGRDGGDGTAVSMAHDQGAAHGSTVEDRADDHADLFACVTSRLSSMGLATHAATGDLVTELVRGGGCEPHVVATLVGGLAAQEVLKLITGHFTPLGGTLLYDGMHCTTTVLPV